MKKKKMILVTHGFPFNDSERSFLTEEVKLLEKEYDLTILAVGEQGSEMKLVHSLSGRFRVVRFSFRQGRSLVRTVRSLTDKDAVKEMCSYLPNLKKAKKVLGFVNRSGALEDAMERIVKKYGADIIYTFWCIHETYAAIKLKKKYPHLRIVSRAHGYDLFKHRALGGIQPMHLCVADKADLLAFVSINGEKYFRREFPGRAETTVSYLGTSGCKKLSPDRVNSFVIASCSNVIPLKRIDRITQALALVKDISIHWIHIGGGEIFEAVKQQAEATLSETDHTLEFTDAVPNNMIENIYSKYLPDLFITASESEGGCPVSIAEAFSCGIPAIATAVGGIPEMVIDGETGFLVSENATPDEIAQAIEKFYALDASQQRRMRENAFDMYKNRFDAAANARRFVDGLKKRFG